MNSNENKQKYFVVYQITNLLNEKIYVGAHATYNINDKYMGSSKILKKDLKISGRQNFKKDILFVFENEESMLLKERELVNKEFCFRTDTYNQIVGGQGGFKNFGMVAVEAKDSTRLLVYKDDPRYLSGELSSCHSGKPGHPSSFKGKSTILKGKTYEDIYGEAKAQELKNKLKGTFYAKNKDGNIIRISKDDPRYISGEFIPYVRGRKQPEKASQLGRKRTNESRQKMSKNRKGSCLVQKDEKRIRIKKDKLSEYQNNGWTYFNSQSK
jgi:hypothetical protein